MSVPTTYILDHIHVWQDYESQLAFYYYYFFPQLTPNIYYKFIHVWIFQFSKVFFYKSTRHTHNEMSVAVWLDYVDTALKLSPKNASISLSNLFIIDANIPIVSSLQNNVLDVRHNQMFGFFFFGNVILTLC